MPSYPAVFCQNLRASPSSDSRIEPSDPSCEASCEIHAGAQLGGSRQIQEVGGEVGMGIARILKLRTSTAAIKVCSILTGRANISYKFVF